VDHLQVHLQEYRLEGEADPVVADEVVLPLVAVACLLLMAEHKTLYCGLKIWH
jgi:Mlc titration factor MtfA (ptsG expression regulator)